MPLICVYLVVLTRFSQIQVVFKFEIVGFSCCRNVHPNFGGGTTLIQIPTSCDPKFVLVVYQM